MKNEIKIALLISTYNWPKALNLVLESVFKQSKLPHEIVIADDGSLESTKEVIASFKQQSKIPIKHIWHEDLGFRKSIILNKAILAVSADYIIQIDGDIILHKHFIKDHINSTQANTFLFGSRISLSKSKTQSILNQGNQTIHYFTKGLKKRNRLLRLPFYKHFTKRENKNSKKIRGCNISYWKKDAMAINGYNEAFVGWGYEDYEFIQRLVNNGVYGKRLKQVALQYHLYHKEAAKGDTTIGDKILTNIIQNKICFIDNGIIKQD